jgi:alpha-tubulin suppressor-like RCC1 family protein
MIDPRELFARARIRLRAVLPPILPFNRVWVWGRDDFSQLGLGLASALGAGRDLAVLPGLSNAKLVDGGSLHSIALGADGRVWAWGDNSFGQAGDGTLAPRPLARVGTQFPPAAAIAAGSFHTLVVSSAGELWAAGSNVWGQLGNGQTGDGTSAVPTPTPVHVTGVTPQSAAPAQGQVAAPVGAGFLHSLAIDNSAHVVAWGWNARRQLGDPTHEQRSLPIQVQIPSAAKPVAVAAGFTHSLALLDDFSVWAWGDNGSGQLGQGLTGGPVSTPVRVTLPGQARSIHAAGAHSAAVLTDGTLWSWGANHFGAVGDGTAVDRATPVKIQVPAVSHAALGWNHGLAESGGRIRAWGSNPAGELGDRSRQRRLSPVAVPVPPQLGGLAVAAGDQTSFAFRPR